MSIKVWIAFRLQTAFRKERKAWRVVHPKMLGMPYWAVDDRRHDDILPGEQHSFDVVGEAEDYVSFRCWMAAVDHLLHFWRKEPK